jgi:hypothetical protein
MQAPIRQLLQASNAHLVDINHVVFVAGFNAKLPGVDGDLFLSIPFALIA